MANNADLGALPMVEDSSDGPMVDVDMLSDGDTEDEEDREVAEARRQVHNFVLLLQRRENDRKTLQEKCRNEERPKTKGPIDACEAGVGAAEQDYERPALVGENLAETSVCQTWDDHLVEAGIARAARIARRSLCQRAPIMRTQTDILESRSASHSF
jgi:hypothetical protein